MYVARQLLQDEVEAYSPEDIDMLKKADLIIKERHKDT